MMDRAVYRERDELRKALEQRAKAEICSCGNTLNVAHHEGQPKLRCGACNTYDGDTKPRYEPTLRGRYRRGEALNAIERMTLHSGLRKEVDAATQAGETPRPYVVALLAKLEADMGLARYEEKTALTNPQDIVRFLDFGKAPNSEALQRQAIALVQRTGLNPALNEVIVYEGKLYVTVHGIGHLAAPYLNGIEPARYWSAEEKKNAGYAEDDIVCSVALHRKGSTGSVVGTGKANAARPYRGNPVEKAFAPRMAENRALRHAYRLGFQDLLSREGLELLPDDITDELEREHRGTRVIDIEPMDMPDEEPPAYEPQAAPEERDDVDVATGELIERVTAAQIADIKAEAGRRKWSTAQLNADIKATYGADRLEDLTGGQAAHLMDHFQMDGKPRG